jgi:drebrin-like protein
MIFQAAEDNEMNLVEGELITQIDQCNEGWWFGFGPDDIKSGLFPSKYVEVIDVPSYTTSSSVVR